MIETIHMTEPTERTANEVMAELASAIVKARDLADELLDLDPNATEPPHSVLSEENWDRLEEDATFWRYTFQHAIELIASHTNCIPAEVEAGRTFAMRGESN